MSPSSNTKKKSPIEFYDEELSRLIRQIQEKLEEAEVANVDRLLGSANMFLQQIEHEVKKQIKRESISSSVSRRRLLPFFQRQKQAQDGNNNGINDHESSQEWLEIVDFRKATLQHLMSERERLDVYG